MFFRKSRQGRERAEAGSRATGKGDRKRPAKTKSKGPSKPKPKARRHLNSSVTPLVVPLERPQVRPHEHVPPARPAVSSRPPTAPPQRGAPLSDETLWLLHKMSKLSRLEDYPVLKEPFIYIYLCNRHHSVASAERAFYSAAKVCLRRLRACRE